LGSVEIPSCVFYNIVGSFCIFSRCVLTIYIIYLISILPFGAFRPRHGRRGQCQWEGERARPSAFVYLAPVRNARDTDKLCHVVDDVHHSPVAHPDAPLVFVAF